MMDEKKIVKTSKFLSLILRHKPEEVGLTLEENGWVKVADLLKACGDCGKTLTLKLFRNSSKHFPAKICKHAFSLKCVCAMRLRPD